MTLTSGWLHIERGTGNAMQIPLIGKPPWKLNFDDDLLYEDDFPGDNHIGVSVETLKRVITCFGLIFSSQTDIENFIANLQTLNLAGTMTLEIQTSSTPSYFKLDGTNTSLEVLYKSVKGVQPLAYGGQQVYVIDQILFKHAG